MRHGLGLMLWAAASCGMAAGLPFFGGGDAKAAEQANTRTITTEQRIDRLERQARQLSTLRLQVDELKRENQQLRGQIELLNHNIDALKRRQRDLYIDIDQRLSQLQAAGVAANPAPTTTTQPAPVSSAAGSEPAAKPVASAAPVDPAREKADYQAAYALLSPEQRRYKEAIAAFQNFLARYPNGELADNAQYWLAEANYVTGNNDAALAEFEKLLAQYPASPKVPGAMLKIGYLQHAAGKADQARQTLEGLVARFPQSPAAGMARQRLERIRREAR